MTCVSPPELEETTLLAFLDGEEGEQVADHMEACLHCRDRAEHLRQIQQELRAGLHRADCPPAFTLGRFHMRALAEIQSQEITRHLESCPHCNTELEMLAEFLSDPVLDRPEATDSPLRLLIARLMRPDDSSSSKEQLAFAAQRGEADGPLTYVADGIQISLSIEADTTDPSKRAIYGLMTGTEPEGWTVRLIQIENEKSAAAVDKNGNFILSMIDPGTYDIVLSLATLQIHIDTLNLTL